MKTFIQLLSAVVLLLTLTLTQSFAQNTVTPQFQHADVVNAGGKTPQERAENQAKHISQKLGLNADQQSKVQASILNRITAMEKVHAMQPDHKGGKIQAHKEVVTKFDSDMKGILSADQYTKFEQIRAQHQQNHEGHNHPHGQGGNH